MAVRHQPIHQPVPAEGRFDGAGGWLAASLRRRNGELPPLASMRIGTMNHLFCSFDKYRRLVETRELGELAPDDP
jgi:hypothetical protein